MFFKIQSFWVNCELSNNWPNDLLGTNVNKTFVDNRR